MALKIAFSGKGGAGKTTLSALAIKYFIDKKITPVLAVDADPNANLNIALGLDFNETIADIREEVLEGKVMNGETKNEFILRRLNEILVEGENVDLLVMGRPESQGCYCAVNHLLREYLSKLARQYKVVVTDTEAGMEHLSRRTTDDLDVLFIVANPDPVSLRAAIRIQDIAGKLKLKIKDKYLILNRLNSTPPLFLKEMMESARLNFIGSIPEDLQVSMCVQEGKAVLGLVSTRAGEALYKIIEERLKKKSD
ncbi:MAG: AAA family ATPase [Candidatus Omnitrophica bacterium]|nr:AAA family ATPase [Candidatus Omnitrophota bacterium]MCM8798188.1 AAA family ATPase [Candidatus Omnitrophota bacterium]